MTSTLATRPSPTRSSTRVVRNDPALQAFWLLRVGFTVAPILFGLDKFFHVLVNWDRYFAAFVLSGGGSLGAVQVGMLQALAERDVRPDLLIGTSAGAINAAYVAGHGTGRETLETLADTWRGLRRQDVFPFDPLRHVLALAGSRDSLCSNRGLRRLIDAYLPYRNLEEAAIPVHIVTTNLLSGEEVLLSTGDAASAVLASATIPGVLPAVEREGLTLVDGGVADNAALSQAVALGADEIYV